MLKRGRSTQEGGKQPSGTGKRACTEKKQQHRLANLFALPTTCLSFIFTFLPLIDNFLVLRRVCRQFNRIAKQPSSFHTVLDSVKFLYSDENSWDFGRSDTIRHLPSGFQPTMVHLNCHRAEGLKQDWRGFSGAKLQQYMLMNIDAEHASAKDIYSFLLSCSQLHALHLVNVSDRFNVLRKLSGEDCTLELDTLQVTDNGHDPTDRFSPKDFELFTAAPAFRSLQHLNISSVNILRESVPHLLSLTQLRDLEAAFEDMSHTLFPQLFKALTRLERLHVTLCGDQKNHLVREDNRVDNPGIVERSLLDIEPSSLHTVTSFTLDMSGQYSFTWRSIAHLCHGTSALRELEVNNFNEPEPLDSKMDAKAVEEAQARDAALASRCAPGLVSLILCGDLADTVTALTTTLSQLGVTLTTLQMNTDMERDENLFVRLARSFRQLQHIFYQGDVHDEDIRWLSTLPHLENLNIYSEDRPESEDLTLRSLAIFTTFPAIKRLRAPVAHLADEEEFGQFEQFVAASNVDFDFAGES